MNTGLWLLKVLFPGEFPFMRRFVCHGFVTRLSWLRESFGTCSGRALVSFFLQCKDTTFADGNHTIAYVAVRLLSEK